MHISGWVAVDVGFSVQADTVAFAIAGLLWLALQRGRFILSSQAETRISFGSMVLSTGLAHENSCTGLASTARSSTCHCKYSTFDIY